MIKPGMGIPHFFFVISASDRFPQDPLVLVPMTSVSEDKRIDDACEMGPGDHHTYVKESFIDYRRSILVSPERLIRFLEEGSAIPKPPPADGALLSRMRQGAEESERVQGEVFDLLFSQGLVRAL